MLKRLVLAIATIALLAAVPSATGVAKADGKSVCRKGGWELLARDDGTTFKNQGSCVSYVAEGGDPRPPFPAAEAACEGSEGTYTAPHNDGDNNYWYVCFWPAQPNDATLDDLAPPSAFNLPGSFQVTTEAPW